MTLSLNGEVVVAVQKIIRREGSIVKARRIVGLCVREAVMRHYGNQLVERAIAKQKAARTAELKKRA